MEVTRKRPTVEEEMARMMAHPLLYCRHTLRLVNEGCLMTSLTFHHFVTS